MKTLLIGTLGLASALSLIAGPAESAVAPRTGTAACLQLVRIDHTRVVDDQNILFYTRSGNIYLNKLDYRVPGLGPNRPFMYRTSIGQICRNDSITVLEDWGFGFVAGATGGLGDFQQIDEAQAKALTGGVQPKDRLEPVETK